jgi:hypothetical protein
MTAPHPPFICNQTRCTKCGYFAPYTNDDDTEGECWRFPHRELIERPHAHSCAEGREWYDDRGEIPYTPARNDSDVQFSEEEFKHLAIALGRMPHCDTCKGILEKINALRWQGKQLRQQGGRK